MNNPYSTYQNNFFQNLSQEEIMLKLFEGAIIRIKQAREMHEEGNMILAREKRSAALKIITELDSTLDRENEATEVVENLDALYGFMIREFNNATLKDDFEKLVPIQEILESLHQGFQDAVQEVRKNSAPTEQTQFETDSMNARPEVRARG